MTQDPQAGGPATKTVHRAFDRIAVPDLPGGVVARPRLFKQLDDALRHPVITVTGPAGWGKTQLLVSWVRSQQLPVHAAWLTVDRSDTDPQLFWPAVMAAVARAKGQVATVQDSVDSVAPVVEALLGVEDDLLLIVDDVHLLQDSQVVSGLDRLVRMLPPQVRILLSGQYLPELSLARLRVEGKLTSVTGKDLAFTTDEAAEMFAQAGAPVPTAVAEALRDRTEGWSAGLRLAILSLADGLAPEALLEEFGGDHVDVADYLMSEVLSRLPARAEDFLLRTAICDRVNGDLAAELTGRQDSAEFLRWMARHNVFTSSDGPRQTWFRYHTMLSELLRSRLHQRGDNTVVDLHLSASSWFATHEMPIEAFDHAAQAERWEKAANIVMDVWLAMYLDGKLVTLGEMIDRLPASLTSRATIDHIRTAVGLALGDASRSPGEGTLAGAGFEAYAQSDVPDQATDEPTPATLPELVVDLERARLAGDLAAAVLAARRLVELSESRYPQPSVSAADVRALAFLQLGMTEYWAGRRSDAEAHLREALDQTTGDGRAYVRLGCLAHLVLALTVQNRLTEGLNESASAVTLVSERGWEFTAAAAELWHALGWVAYLRGDLDLAEIHLERASLAVRRHDAAVTSTVLLVRGALAALRGRKRDALAMLDEAGRAMARIRGHFVFADYVIGEQARLRVAVGDLAGARALLAQHPEGPAEPIHVSIARAELHTSEGHPTLAVDLLQRAVREGTGLVDQRLQAMALLTILRARAGDEIAAHETMREALVLAAPEGFVQPFLQFGPVIARHLEAAATGPLVDADFVAEILTRAGPIWLDADPNAAPSAPAPDGQPTERELEVLGALDSLDSLADISASLFISVNTLKTHLRSLYRKLDAGSRWEAVAKAKALGLISAR